MNNLREYRDSLLSMEKSPATIDKYLRDIRTFYRWLDTNSAAEPATTKNPAAPAAESAITENPATPAVEPASTENPAAPAVEPATTRNPAATSTPSLQGTQTPVKQPPAESREIKKETTIVYKAWLQQHYKTASVNSMLVALNRYLDYIGQPQAKVRTVKIQHQMFCGKEKEMTLAEYKRLIRTARQRGQEQTALIMETIGSTGIRVSELKFITVAAVKSGTAEVACKGKRRQVCLVKELRDKLRLYCLKRNIKKGAIFVTRRGNPLDRSNIWAKMKETAKAAGVSLEKVFPHNLRHLFARVFWQKWKDVFYLADILGHSSVNTTRIYTVTTVASHARRLGKLKLVP